MIILAITIGARLLYLVCQTLLSGRELTTHTPAETFARKAEEAINGRQEHVEAFVEFDAALPEESTKAWTQLCQKWEEDSTNENPFRVVQTSKIFQ
jgi:hypothetical protein